MMNTSTPSHWAFESEVNLQTRIASDFLAQIEKKIAEKEWTHAELANAKARELLGGGDE